MLKVTVTPESLGTAFPNTTISIESTFPPTFTMKYKKKILKGLLEVPWGEMRAIDGGARNLPITWNSAGHPEQGTKFYGKQGSYHIMVIPLTRFLTLVEYCTRTGERMASIIKPEYLSELVEEIHRAEN